MKILAAWYLGMATAMWAPFAAAQQYPDHPVTWVVPWAAGGASDTVARIVAERLGSKLGQPIIIENRPGAGGNVGTEYVGRARPDGYTLVQLTDATTVSPALYSKLGFDAVTSFAPITLIATGPHVIVTRADGKIKSLADMVTMAKSQQGGLNYASAGVGSAQHLAGELFKRTAGIPMIHVPYKGGAPALVDVLSGQVSVGIFGLAPALPYITSGKLRAIAVTGAQRAPTLPDVPTVAESGYPGFASVQWFGIAAPAGTPAGAVAKLHADIVDVLHSPDVDKKLRALGAEIVAGTPEQFTQYIHDDRQRWGNIVRDAHIQID
jgi:tripartite-type tricarboxylate transporter receptor subunit TctC